MLAALRDEDYSPTIQFHPTAVVREAEPAARYGILTTGLPATASGGGALKAVTGARKPVAVVVDLLAADAVAHLRAAGR